MRKFAIALAAAILLTAGAAMAATNLNTATEQQLEQLNGIGPSKAQAIIAYRTQNGPFKSIQDLSKVPGFGDKTVASLQNQLSVTGPNTPSATTSATNSNNSNTAPASTATPANAPASNSKMPAGSTPSNTAPAASGNSGYSQ